MGGGGGWSFGGFLCVYVVGFLLLFYYYFFLLKNCSPGLTVLKNLFSCLFHHRVSYRSCNSVLRINHGFQSGFFFFFLILFSEECAFEDKEIVSVTCYPSFLLEDSGSSQYQWLWFFWPQWTSCPAVFQEYLRLFRWLEQSIFSLTLWVGNLRYEDLKCWRPRGWGGNITEGRLDRWPSIWPNMTLSSQKTQSVTWFRSVFPASSQPPEVMI